MGNDDRRHAPAAGRVARPKMAEDVARRLEQLVIENGWPEGTILGSEPALIERFGVSRAVFREAVRIVEHHGAARMRRGPKGGLMVTAPDPRSVLRPATLYLDYAKTSTAELFTVRTALELTSIGMLAARLTESDAARLRAAVIRESELGSSACLGDLHVLIAELTGNPAMELFVRTLAQVTEERNRGLPALPEEFGQLHAAHEGIVAAILARNGRVAEQRMREHLAASLRFYARRG
jgi:DNA-binding FadR family transcriptional regulator